jgi:hypothetical protein
MSQIDDDDLPAPSPDPEPRTSLLTITLCVLNVAAVLAFGYLLVMNLATRQRWTRLAFLHDVAIQGLPLLEEADKPSAAHSLAPAMTLEPEWLQEAYKQRGGKTVGQDKFRPGELEMQRVRPQDLSDEILKDVFTKAGGNPIGSLDEEIVKLGKDLPARIESAVEGAPKNAKDEQQKRQLLYAYLLPLAYLTGGVDQTKDLWSAVQATPAAQLDALITDAARRRMLVDILSRLEEYRPYDLPAKEDPLRNAAALSAKAQSAGLSPERYTFKTDELNDLLLKRVRETMEAKDANGQDRHELEKRRTVAFLLFTLSRIKGADGTPLYSPDRAEVVSGIREFTQAADTMPLVLERLANRLLDAIQLDRGQQRYAPLDYRIRNPKLFAERLTALLDTMKVPIKNKAAFQKAAEEAFTFKEEKDKIRTDDKETASQKALAKVKKLMQDQGIGIIEEKEDAAQKRTVRQAQFDQAVMHLVDDLEPGFVGRHHDLVKQIADLAARIRQMENRLKELQTQQTQSGADYKVREQHVTQVASKVIAARERTLRLAQDLAVLQQERWRAQVELSNADRDNRIMERRIRELELSKKGRGKPR